jgi:tRNA/rRNA methyltransferase
VLVEPQFDGNLGAAARALKNLGFTRLALVAPTADPGGREARMMAVEAGDVLAAAERHATLDTALRGAGAVVGLSRRLGKHRQPHLAFDRLAPELRALADRGEIALLFGREDHGLSDAALDRATHLAYLPTDSAYDSFNLAQAVLLVAYELRRATRADYSAAPLSEVLADDEAREGLYGHLQEAFVAIGFLSRDTVEPIMRRLRRLFGRVALTREEVQLLRGIARQTLWVARRAGLGTPTGTDQGAPPDEPRS